MPTHSVPDLPTGVPYFCARDRPFQMPPRLPAKGRVLSGWQGMGTSAQVGELTPSQLRT